MTAEQLYQQLSEQYKILLFKDLADATATPQALYQLLQSAYQTVYQPQDRLVLYTSHAVEASLQAHVSTALKTLDISECFFMLHYDAALNSAPLQSNYRLSNTICPLPWSHLEIGNFGDVKACCVSRTQLGKIHQDLETLFYSQPMQQLRADLIAGKQSSNCQDCWITESHGQTSYRQRQLAVASIPFLTTWIDNPVIRSLDIKPGTVCNFKCRICGSDASSKHAEEQIRFSQNLGDDNLARLRVQQGQWFEDSPEFADKLISLLPGIENFDFYGGEPFLLKQLTRLISTAVSQGHADHIRLHFNSNGSIFPAHLIEFWSQFKEINLAISIDNVGARFELERGGSWSVIKDNIDRFSKLNLPNFKCYLFPSINIQNVLYLDELYAWAESTGLEITPNYVLEPQCFSIDNLTDRAKSLVVDKFSNSDNAEIQKIVHRITKSAGSDGREFVQVMKNFDKMRAQRFDLTHKEIAIAMGYSVQ
jgi:sulfatase maturation enzyme AslB (radical SAM superfamily)